jgi:hypothetical protein
MKPSGQILDLATKHKTEYCIPTWLRDEQIRVSIKRVSGRLGQEHRASRSDPIAVVCFGPSLKATWEEVKGYKYAISGSGSHKFLLEHGITPTWHVDVDPRPHKTKLIGPPNPNVVYLPASTVNPVYWDYLEAGLGPDVFRSNVLLWHVFDNTEEGLRILPQGEWAITGGSNVGLRQIALAVFLGFSNIHVYGMDGCMDESGSHAAEHPNQPPGYHEVDVNGKRFRTTQSYLECAKQTFHELNMLPKANVTFHGEGIVQELAKDYKREEPKDGMMAFVGYSKHVTISDEYLELQKKLHSDILAYGVGGGKYAEVVKKLCEVTKSKSVLDYGCGKGYLGKALDFPIWEFDPAIHGKTESPRPADIVICNDVLEHIEPDKIDFVLDDLRRVIRQVGYFVIHTGPASKFLADGRNAHILQHDLQWWKGKLAVYFSIGKITQAGLLLHVVVGPHGSRAGKRKAVTA